MRRIVTNHKIIVSLTLFVFLIINSFCQSPTRILPLGNSITVGEYTANPMPTVNEMRGYRFGLKYLLSNAGYSVDFVGSQESGSSYFSDCQHAGIGGSRDQYVARLLTDGYDQKNGVQIINPPGPYLDVYNPDIILLHIGTNDVTHETDCITNQQVSAILDLVDQYEVRAVKEVTVFLALIINRKLPCIAGSGCATTSAFNNAIKAMAEARIAAGDKIVIVDMEHDAGFLYDDSDMSDQLHPNENGYSKMALLWFNAITQHFNVPPVITSIPDQAINEGGSFTNIMLDNYVADTEDPDEDIDWSFTQLGSQNLTITIDQNRVMHIAPKDIYWNGSQAVRLVATDNGINGNFVKSDAYTIVFTVNPVNNLPIITAQIPLSIMEDSELTLHLSDFTIFDPDSDPSDFHLNILSGSHYSINGNKVLPTQNYDSDFTVNVSVSDAIGQGPVYVASVSVIPVNDNPVYSGQSSIQINEDTQYTFNIQDINVSDPDNSNSELSIIMHSGSNYTLSGNKVIPIENYFGTLSVPSTIRDPLGAESASFNLVITVKSVNDLPVFTSTPKDTAIVDNYYVYAISANDPDDAELTIIVSGNPAWLPFDSEVRYFVGKPEIADIGIDHITIILSDGEAEVEQSFYLHVISSHTPVEDHAIMNQPRVFPNPATDQITISGDFYSSKVRFNLFDVCGRLTGTYQFINENYKEIRLDEFDISPGIYFYTILIDEHTYSGKLIIQSQ